MEKKFKSVLLIGIFAHVNYVSAQNTYINRGDSIKNIMLENIVVESKNILHNTDGETYIPKMSQRKLAANGLDLIDKMKIPGLKIDEVQKTVNSITPGEVQIRINGVEATIDELTALLPSQIKSINYITMPGMRYGKDVSSVLDLKVARVAAGYAMGINAMNALSTLYNDDNIWGRFNFGKSELGVRYTFKFNDNNKVNTTERQLFQMGTGQTKEICKEGRYEGSKYNVHNLVLSYNYAGTKRVFDVKLESGWNSFPDRTLIENVLDDNSKYQSTIDYKDKGRSTAVKLYYAEKFNERHDLSAYLTLSQSNSDYERGFQMPYAKEQYNVDGSKYSAYGELNYSIRFKKNSTLAFGYQQGGAYTRNDYIQQDDNTFATRIHDDMQYLFTEYSGKFNSLSLKLGIGGSHEHFSNTTSSYSYWMLRPNVNLQYAFTDNLSLSYQYQNECNTPSLSQLTPFLKRDNYYEYSIGNEKLKPYHSNIHTMKFTYATKPSYIYLSANYIRNNNSIVECPVKRMESNNETYFLYTEDNDADTHRLQVNLYADHYFFNNKLLIYVMPGFVRDIVNGKEYTHTNSCWNVRTGASAYLGRFTIDCDYSSATESLYGETLVRQYGSANLSAAYKWNDLSVKLGIRNLFNPKGAGSETERLSDIVYSYNETRNKAFGNMIYLSVSWNFSNGKKSNNARVINKNASTDTGIIK